MSVSFLYIKLYKFISFSYNKPEVGLAQQLCHSQHTAPIAQGPRQLLQFSVSHSQQQRGRKLLSPLASFIKGVIQKPHKLVFIYQWPKLVTWTHLVVRKDGKWSLQLSGIVMEFSYQNKKKQKKRDVISQICLTFLKIKHHTMTYTKLLTTQGIKTV